MERNSSSPEKPALEYTPGASLRTRKNYGRHIILAPALLLGLTLVLTTWFAWRDAEALADTVSEGQSELYLRAYHDFNRLRPPERGFEAVLRMYAESGLRGAGAYSSEGHFEVFAGSFQAPVPNENDRPAGRMLRRVGNRYRVLARLPRHPPPPLERGHESDKPFPDGPPPHGPPEWNGHPPDDEFPPPPEDSRFDAVAFEFEPLLATGLTQRARVTFFLATGVATLLALAAIVLWRRAEREENLGARLVQAERLASLGTMSAVLAHEIKNPLASLKGNAQLLAESLPPDGRSRAQADRVVEAALRLQGLVQNLLDFVRGGPIERNDIDPAELLFLAAEDAAPTATLELDDAPPIWSLDAIRMRQVLENLLRNALQASKQGLVKARVFVKSDHLVYIVEDDGPGFPPEDLENVFEPFVTTKARGVGLGLAVARRIVVMHDGTIGARNKADGGAEVTVSIPRMRGREEGSHGANSRSG